MAQERDDEKVTVYCWGGCGRSVQLRKASIRDGDIVCCRDGFGDTRYLPLYPGKVRTFSEHKQEDVIFWKIRDVWPDASTIQSIWEAQEIWAYTLAELAIEEAMEKALGGRRNAEQDDDLTIGEELAMWAERDKRRQGLK